MRHQPSRSLANLVAALGCLALATALGCGDDTGDGSTGNGGSGGGSSSSSSSSGNSSNSASSNSSSASSNSSSSGSSSDGGGGTGGDGGAGVGGQGGAGVGGQGGAGVGGQGGAGVGASGGAGGGPDVEPEMVLQVIGDPAWEPVDFHLISVDVGDGFENFFDVLTSLLPEPEHTPHPQIGIGPGEAHDGFDTEHATNVAAQGYVDSAVFTQAEASSPNALMSLLMLVPTDAAPAGSSPDFASGPIIPNTAFPIAVEISVFQDDVQIEDYAYGFEVPALDGDLDPPFDVDGHSHIPLFDAITYELVPNQSGEVEVRLSIVDANGDGYDVSYAITVE